MRQPEIADEEVADVWSGAGMEESMWQRAGMERFPYRKGARIQTTEGSAVPGMPRRAKHQRPEAESEVRLQ